MADKKRSPAYLAGYKAGEAVGEAMTRILHRMLGPTISSVLKEIAEAAASEAECEDEDIPDCQACESHGNCPFEPGTVYEYEVPPGYVLVHRGPPDPLSWN